MAASQNTLLASRSSSASATGRRLLSRIASPFSPKPRSLTEYYIRPDEPHRQYAPGDTLKGAVVVTVVKPIRITHLVVSLRGHVRVFKHGSTESAYLSDSFSTSGQGKRAGEYYGNGFASLFQDEVVLCGEGRLESGVYEFKFELDFPEKGLPSSIDFERGTISYTVTSTLTRPTTISPTTSCDRKVHLVEVVDIGPLMQPKSQTITLEPIRRSHRAKEKSKENKRRELLPRSQRRESSSSSVLQSTAAEERDAASRKSSDDVAAEEPDSPVASEISGASAASGSTGSFRSVPNPSVSRSSTRGTKGPATNTTKTITTTIEILRSGCLAGDFLPVKIHVSHTKPIKSLHGVIITLYRQGRIDSHPALSPVRAGKQADSGSEDYYPKSRSGLGGLSLSSAGSSSTFRKDLSQTFAPIIVNPRTLMAEVKASVKVPDEAFPTIASVPGGIISFRYYVEVVIDLNGKLPELETCLPRPGTVNTPSNYWRRGDQSSNAGDEGMESVLAALGGSIIDTDQVRREKSVVACLFEVLVGTKDSTRDRSRRKSDHQHGLSTADEELGGDDRSADQVTSSAGPTEVDGCHRFPPQDTVPSYVTSHPDQNPVSAPIEIPPPELDDGPNIDEKTMMRNAEQRLLPSAPPDGQGAHSEDSQSAAPPSAPAMSDLSPGVSGPHLWTDATATSTEALGLASQRQDHPTATEDKQDLERQRLQAQASAPDDDGPSADELPDATPEAQPPVLPSAPVITEDDENGRYGGYQTHGGAEARSAANTSRNGEHLPKYER